MFLNVTKKRVIENVYDLNDDELDYVHDSKTPTIGTLLKHLAATEYWFGIWMFEERTLNEKENEFWNGALPLQLLNRKIHSNSLDYYLDLWKQVRAKTLVSFKKVNDKWLYLKTTGEYNNYFAWFHIMEDHLSHLGQIKSIKSRVRKKYE